MNTWASRIRSRMKELNMTHEELASKLDVTRGAITHYLSGRRVPPLRKFQKLATILKADPAWLQFGSTNAIEPDKLKPTKSNAHRPIPVLTWKQAADYDAGSSSKKAANESLPHFFTDQPHWYALPVKGDAMTASLGQQKSFCEGEMLIVNPDKEPTHGDFVIAVLPKAKDATFKQYVEDGGIRYLKPLNPQYPLTQLDKSTSICGVVVSCLSLFT